MALVQIDVIIAQGPYNFFVLAQFEHAVGSAIGSPVVGHGGRRVVLSGSDRRRDPSDRHDVRSLDVARLAHFTHCGKPPSKINGRYDACARLHREWRETWARVAAESGVVA